jgi:formate/nitrite transporter FocA (FNT family)
MPSLAADVESRASSWLRPGAWKAMAFSGRSVVDKAVAIVFPISAFVVAGFDYSVANMYFIPLALMLRAAESVEAVWPAISCR